MGTVLEFKASPTARPRQDGTAKGEIVIFPGVRIERHDLDLAHRIRNAAATGEFRDLGSKQSPSRKTS